MATEEPDAMPFADAIDIPEGAELSDVAVGYWEAWQSLTSDRPWGAMGGAGRIPWSAIDRYAEKHFFDTDDLTRMLWAMDDVYLSWMDEQAKAKAAASKA